MLEKFRRHAEDKRRQKNLDFLRHLIEKVNPEMTEQDKEALKYGLGKPNKNITPDKIEAYQATAARIIKDNIDILRRMGIVPASERVKRDIKKPGSVPLGVARARLQS